MGASSGHISFLMPLLCFYIRAVYSKVKGPLLDVALLTRIMSIVLQFSEVPADWRTLIAGHDTVIHVRASECTRGAAYR